MTREQEAETMSESVKHTPGPWHVYEHPIPGRADAIMELIEQVQATDPVVDNIYLIDAGGKCPATTGCGPTSRANANLIAAAPEMLEALRQMVVNSDADGKAYRDCHKKALAAIAKATGGQP